MDMLCWPNHIGVFHLGHTFSLFKHYLGMHQNTCAYSGINLLWRQNKLWKTGTEYKSLQDQVVPSYIEQLHCPVPSLWLSLSPQWSSMCLNSRAGMVPVWEGSWPLNAASISSGILSTWLCLCITSKKSGKLILPPGIKVWRTLQNAHEYILLPSLDIYSLRRGKEIFLSIPTSWYKGWSYSLLLIRCVL